MDFSLGGFFSVLNFSETFFVHLSMLVNPSFLHFTLDCLKTETFSG